MLAEKQRHMIIKNAILSYSLGHLQFKLLAQSKVFHTVARRCMNQSCTCLQGYVNGWKQRNSKVIAIPMEWMISTGSFKFCALKEPVLIIHSMGMDDKHRFLQVLRLGIPQ